MIEVKFTGLNEEISLLDLDIGETAIITSCDDLESIGKLVICCGFAEDKFRETRIVEIGNSNMIWGPHIEGYKCRKVNIEITVKNLKNVS